MARKKKIKPFRAVTAVKALARERMGAQTHVEVQLVDTIPRTRNGKFKGVVCNV